VTNDELFARLHPALPPFRSQRRDDLGKTPIEPGLSVVPHAFFRVAARTRQTKVLERVAAAVSPGEDVLDGRAAYRGSVHRDHEPFPAVEALADEGFSLAVPCPEEGGVGGHDGEDDGVRSRAHPPTIAKLARVQDSRGGRVPILTCPNDEE
jgi:hypothetical protein